MPAKNSITIPAKTQNNPIRRLLLICVRPIMSEMTAPATQMTASQVVLSSGRESNSIAMAEEALATRLTMAMRLFMASLPNDGRQALRACGLQHDMRT